MLHGEMTLGTLLAANQPLWQVYGPLQWFAQVNQWFSRAMAGAERIFEVIDQQPEAYDRAERGAAAGDEGGGQLRQRPVRLRQEQPGAEGDQPRRSRRAR